MVWLLLEQHPTASHRVRVLAFAAGAAAGRGADRSGTLTSPASPCSVTSPVALLPMQPAGAPQVCGGAAVRHERLWQVHAGVHPGALGAAGQVLLVARAGGQHGSISWVGRHEGGLQLDHGGLAVHPVASPTPCLLDHRTPPTFQPAPPWPPAQANRLGINTVISTDSVRHMLRSFTTKEESPLLYASTYQVCLRSGACALKAAA